MQDNDAIESKQVPSSGPKYLFLDHSDTLTTTMKKVKSSDLFLKEQGGKNYELAYDLLPNGKQIVQDLDLLVNQHGYRLAFCSANNEEFQLGVLQSLREASKKAGLNFPPIYAMVVHDPKNYKETTSDSPIIEVEPPSKDPKESKDYLEYQQRYQSRMESNSGYPIRTATYGIKEKAKTCSRKALIRLLETTPQQCIVFDDDYPAEDLKKGTTSIIAQAKSEGYEAYKVIYQYDGNHPEPLSKHISAILKREQLQKGIIVPNQLSAKNHLSPKTKATIGLIIFAIFEVASIGPAYKLNSDWIKKTPTVKSVESFFNNPVTVYIAAFVITAIIAAIYSYRKKDYSQLEETNYIPKPLSRSSNS